MLGLASVLDNQEYLCRYYPIDPRLAERSGQLALSAAQMNKPNTVQRTNRLHKQKRPWLIYASLYFL